MPTTMRSNKRSPFVSSPDQAGGLEARRILSVPPCHSEQLDQGDHHRGEQADDQDRHRDESSSCGTVRIVRLGRAPWRPSRPSPARSTPTSSGTTLDPRAPDLPRRGGRDLVAPRRVRGPRRPAARLGPDELHEAAMRERTRRRRARGARRSASRPAMFLGRDVEFSRAGRRGDRPPGRALHRASTPTTTCRRSSSPATRTRSPTCSSTTSSRGSRAPRSRPRSSSARPTSPGVTENIEKVHRAVARASVRTGAPIMAHSRPASQTGLRADRDLRGGGRRPVEGPDRPHRRHRRPRLHRAAAREGRLHRHGPLRPRDLPADRAAQRDRARAARARLRRPHVPLAGLLRDARLVPGRGRASSCWPPAPPRTGA